MESLEETKIYDDEELLMILVDDENDKKQSVAKEPPDEATCDDEVLLKSEEYLDINEEDDDEYKQETADSDAYTDEEYLKIKNKSQQNEWQRHKLRLPEEQQSYVNELREQYPDLKDDEELLIDMLYEIMLKVKPPEPPKQYFVMKGSLFECTDCGLKKQTKPAIFRHWQFRHGPRYAICFACGDDFRDVTTLYRHEKRCNAPDAIVVLKARARTLGNKGRGRPFLSETKPSKRSKKALAGTEFPCEYCDSVFRNSRQLHSHLSTHAGLRPYRCNICPARYASPVVLYTHKSTKHRDTFYLCDKCDRTFLTNYKLKLHMETHLQVRRYTCGHCDKRYTSRRNLRFHVDKVHLQLPPPLVCHCCPKRFFKIERLKSHMYKLHGMNLISQHSLQKRLPYLSESQLKMLNTPETADLYFESPPGQNKNNTVEENSVAQSAPQTVRVYNEKAFDFLKCTEKIESGSEIEQREPVEIHIQEDDITETQISEDDYEEEEEEEEPDDSPKDLLEYANQLQPDSDKTKPLIVIKDGQAIFMDKNDIYFYKQQATKRNNCKIEIFKPELIADANSSIQISKSETIDSGKATKRNNSKIEILQQELIADAKSSIQISKPETIDSGKAKKRNNSNIEILQQELIADAKSSIQISKPETIDSGKAKKRNNSKIEILKQELIADAKSSIQNSKSGTIDSVKPTLQEEKEDVITETNRVVTLKNRSITENLQKQAISQKSTMKTRRGQRRRKPRILL